MARKPLPVKNKSDPARPAQTANQIRASIRANLQKMIEAGIWQVAMTTTQNPKTKLTYTIGLTEIFHHPELFAVGLPPNIAHAFLNNAGRLIKEGRRFFDGAISDKIMAEGHLVAFRKIPIVARANHAKLCDDRYDVDGYDALQLFIPDAEQRFPWNTGCNQQFINLQCNLFRIGHTSPPPINYEHLARHAGAKPITGLGQFRVGHGRHVTDWCATETEAWKSFCEIAGIIPTFSTLH